ncbi:MAG: sodium:proton antiporter [Salinisphaeraceae bacterium]|nr:sodium:proton antiporter [Salinisphaeraceae bacterium]
MIGLLAGFPLPALAAVAEGPAVDFTVHWAGFVALAVFILAYGLVIAEDRIHLSKSKPVIVAAGIIWAVIALAFAMNGDTHSAEIAVRHSLLEFAELMLFLLAAMTYINTMEERGVFDALRGWLVSRGFSLRGIFWITGVLAFCISPLADNMTTALLLSTVVLAVGGGDARFVVPACVNIVVAANAGGAFSPFGDITTLMVWQKGVVDFVEFFDLFLPSLVNWLVPALIIVWAVPRAKPAPLTEAVVLKKGARRVITLFLVTISLAVTAHTLLHLPPVLGMMTGLGLLKLFGYYLRHREQSIMGYHDRESAAILEVGEYDRKPQPFDIFRQVERAEWDTLLFFYGIILCVGGLGTLGYLALLSEVFYGGFGPLVANILVGLASAVVDNIPVMYAVLTMLPEMSHGHWLLVTLTAGVGGSLLSIGSAAGVAVMGQARGVYTFFAHLKWSWAIALGYIISIAVHLFVNQHLF